MSRSFFVLAGILAVAATAHAAPLTPTITGHDINFGAYNMWNPTPEWKTNGTAPDTLTFTRNASPPYLDHEATAYWPAWPPQVPQVTHPIFDESGSITPPAYPEFGGDLVLNVMFTGQDAPFVNPAGAALDVSLVGTGANPAGPDLQIYGNIPGVLPVIPGGHLLWALDLDTVALYGYSGPKWSGGSDAYVLEGAGVIVGGELAALNNLIGQPGAMRGNLDFPARPSWWIPSLYKPSDDVNLELRAAYSGETGAVPEPATMALLIAGVLLGLPRRRTHV